ncbi:hypothetical protein [Pseudomonas viridiflava]|uniref:hypothetical protein n=1 Tax=Pseudomonas viridiflava TaxID=33069 RepID=UPI000F067F73|nr:hypothetical protein [Pseudomonas viridiflava]
MVDARQQSPSLIELGQVTAVSAPFAYLLGQKHAAGYFNELGCTWVADYLTFQETLTYALPTSLLIVTGAVLAYFLFSHNVSVKTQVSCILGIPLLIIAGAFILSFFTTISVTNVFTPLANIWLCMLFGFYSVEALHTYNLPDRKGFVEASGWALSSAFTVFTLASGIGSMVATADLDRIDDRFPVLTEPGLFGSTKERRLVAKVGDRFLIMEGSTEKHDFYLKSNLDNFKILPIHKKTSEHNF